MAPNCSASTSAAADLPLAVGPAMRSARLNPILPRQRPEASCRRSPLVATLIADPRKFRFSDARIARAAQGVAGIRILALARPRRRGGHLFPRPACRDPRRARTGAGRRADRRHRPARRAAVEAPPGRRHGFDPDRPGMRRRARGLCRRRRECGDDHRSRDAGRHRLRAGFARAGGAARRIAGARDRRRTRGTASRSTPARKRWRAPCERAARESPSYRAAFASSRPLSPRGSAPTRTAPTRL